jgi:hypothetical protein
MWQPSVDSRFHKSRIEKRQAQRHSHEAITAAFARGDFFRIQHFACDKLSEPQTTSHNTLHQARSGF